MSETAQVELNSGRVRPWFQADPEAAPFRWLVRSYHRAYLESRKTMSRDKDYAERLSAALAVGSTHSPVDETIKRNFPQPPPAPPPPPPASSSVHSTACRLSVSAMHIACTRRHLFSSTYAALTRGELRAVRVLRGRAVQVESIKSTLKAPGTQRSKLTYDEPLSIFAFKVNVRRYDVGLLLNPAMADMFPQPAAAAARGALQLFDEMASPDGLPPGFMEEFAARFQAGPGPGPGCVQGLTLVHFSAQRKRFLWDRGCIWGRLGGVEEMPGAARRC